jgi:uncharacterized membrane protein
MNDINTAQPVNTSTAKLVYILYLVGLIFPITCVIGVIMAYIHQAEAPAWLQSHYRFQIRTFWMALLYAMIGAILFLVLIGWFVFLFLLIWLIVRCVKGLKALDQQREVSNETRWMF